MKIAIFIILYLVGVIYIGAYFYKEIKTETPEKRVSDTDRAFILLLSIFFPIIYILGILMMIIEKIGDKLCKDQ